MVKYIYIYIFIYIYIHTYTGLFEMIVGVLTTCHTQIQLRQEYMFLFI